MKSILLTAFQPFGEWKTNASWLVLQEFIRDLPPDVSVTTRLYQVDFDTVARSVTQDVSSDYDVVLHLGQRSGSSSILFEQFAINIRQEAMQVPDEADALILGGASAYESSLPLGDWARALRDSGIPSQVSFNGGCYICNAVFYHTLSRLTGTEGAGKAAFIHFPLTTEQAVTEKDIRQKNTPSLPCSLMVDALRQIVLAC